MVKLSRIAVMACATALVAGCLAAVPAQPAQAAGSQVSGVAVKAASSTSLKVTWKKVKGAEGYEVAYSVNKNMAGVKTAKAKGAAKRSKTVKSLKKCTKYYVQVRAYKKSGTKTLYGKWSKKKYAKTSHAYAAQPGKAATLLSAGYTAHKKCSKCGAVSGKATLAKLAKRANVNAYSWAELKYVADRISACSSEYEALSMAIYYNLCPADGKLTGFEVKNVIMPVKFTADGSYLSATVQVQILGFNHDDKADGSGKAGITFGFKNIVDFRQMNSSDVIAGGWKSSSMRSWLNGTFLGKLPSDLSAQIVPVRKATNNIGQTTSASSVNSTTDSVWLPSFRECYGGWTGGADYAAVYGAEGSQYKLYADNGVTTSNYSLLNKLPAGSASSGWWWLRSPSASGSINFRGVNSDGGRDAVGIADSSRGVSPGFCL